MAAEDAVKLALAVRARRPSRRNGANRELTPRRLVREAIGRRRRRFRAQRRGAGSLAWAEGVLRAGPAPRVARRRSKGGALRRAAPAGPRRARAARGPLAQRPPSLERRRRQAGARAAWLLQSAAVARASRRSWPSATRRAILHVRQGDGVRGGRGDAARPPTSTARRRPAAARAGAADDCCVCFDALGDKATILRCGTRCTRRLPRRVAAAGRRHVSALQGAGRAAVAGSPAT